MITPREFQQKRNQMLNYYFEIENEFNEITRIIPLENESNTFSPKLYSILQNSCVQVENMLRLLCDKFQLDYRDKRNFPKYYEMLNKNGVLKQQRIAMEKKHETLYPFDLQDGSETPFWWSSYNKTKHNLPDGFKQGNLRNTIYALSAGYAIHCMSYYAQYSSEQILNKEKWHYTDVIYIEDGKLARNNLDPLPKSDLFYYSSRFNERGATL